MATYHNLLQLLGDRIVSKNKSGYTKEEREHFLKEHGMQELRSPGGGSSHSVWYNPEFRKLVLQGKATMPANLACNRLQAWEVTLCQDPASGTWRTIEKQVSLMHEKVQEAANARQIHKKRSELSRAFRKAALCYKRKRHLIKQLFKAGAAELASVKVSPDYEHMKELANLKHQTTQQLQSARTRPA